MLGTKIKKRRFGVGEYHRMAEVGILGEDDRVELADGEVVEMTPVGWRHVRAVTVLTQLLAGTLPGHYVSVQNPVVFGERDERQPDLALVRAGALEGSLPTAADVALVVEVAETSLLYDREVKVPLYARAGIPEAWVVDLEAATVEVHAAPGASPGERYAKKRTFGREEELISFTVPDLRFAVGDVVGRG
ncbi:Putative restriction endonuclease (plasmid) [Rubrobacter radiotolerans]|nr:Uma2 family endonuclease [Rubrobacter radiotolerans]AHY48123.1 Putative restriction endonuclease [Rubrobacter radiotolerans]SMC01757.1 Endonuclease, Uma2 family (restriction endonuclease fold) [Rubrobacter radiotolerans DSM 5868]